MPLVYYVEYTLVHGCLEEAPPEEDDNDQAQGTKRAILLEQQLPVDAHRSAAVFLAVVPQTVAHLAHTLETVAPVEKIFNVLRHDFCNVAQLVVETVEVLGSAGVRVRGACAVNKGVELHEGVGAEREAMDLSGGIDCSKFAGEVGEVCEGEFAGVGAVGDADEYDIAIDEITKNGRGSVMLDTAAVLYAEQVDPWEHELAVETYWRLCCEDSRLACCSAFRLSFRSIWRTCDLISASEDAS
jgi:hypothetical protein